MCSKPSLDTDNAAARDVDPFAGNKGCTIAAIGWYKLGAILNINEEQKPVVQVWTQQLAYCFHVKITNITSRGDILASCPALRIQLSSTFPWSDPTESPNAATLDQVFLQQQSQITREAQSEL